MCREPDWVTIGKVYNHNYIKTFLYLKSHICTHSWVRKGEGSIHQEENYERKKLPSNSPTLFSKRGNEFIKSREYDVNISEHTNHSWSVVFRMWVETTSGRSSGTRSRIGTNVRRHGAKEKTYPYNYHRGRVLGSLVIYVSLYISKSTPTPYVLGNVFSTDNHNNKSTQTGPLWLYLLFEYHFLSLRTSLWILDCVNLHQFFFPPYTWLSRLSDLLSGDRSLFLCSP